jgi:hypothetical protein
VRVALGSFGVALFVGLIIPGSRAFAGSGEPCPADVRLNGWSVAGIGQQAAPAPVQAEVTLVLATNQGDGGVDPRIGKLPRFGDYKAYRLLSRTNVTIQKSPPASTRLPNGRTLQMALKEVRDSRYIIDTSINQPDGATFLPLVELRATVDVPVYFAGQTYEGGMLIIGIKVLPR